MVRYSCCLIYRKMLKSGTAKVGLGPYIVEKAKIKYGWDSDLFKMLKQGTAGVLYWSSIVQKAKI